MPHASEWVLTWTQDGEQLYRSFPSQSAALAFVRLHLAPDYPARSALERFAAWARRALANLAPYAG